MSESQSPVRTVDKAIDVLEYVAAAARPPSLTELAVELGLPPATAHRLTRALLGRGLLRQVAHRRYLLGPRLIHLGTTADQMTAQWVQPFLDQLAAECGETVNLAVLARDKVTYIAQAQSHQMVRMFTEVGRTVLPHCTAVGKVLMAELRDADVLKIVEANGMPKQTPNTITSTGELMAEIDMIREQGYAEDREEQELAVRCVAVRVPGEGEHLAISISGPKSRILEFGIERLLVPLKRTAQGIAAARVSDA